MPFAFPGDELNEAEEEGGGKRRAEKRAASVRKQARIHLYLLLMDGCIEYRGGESLLLKLQQQPRARCKDAMLNLIFASSLSFHLRVFHIPFLPL